ncbi:unnamed protein product [Heligmosomoides polygyrus]|uniref:Pecanex-like protein n=1 Tax=Heligmosomoides polygyrus TaxID=6339 RepID=A0A3P8CXC3_HELPZ|nr:unnamed protein product [Heligmosomoides polygyrus]
MTSATLTSSARRRRRRRRKYNTPCGALGDVAGDAVMQREEGFKKAESDGAIDLVNCSPEEISPRPKQNYIITALRQSKTCPSAMREDVPGRRRGDVEGSSCSTPPLMTSTPYTTLERRDRIQTEMLGDGQELRQSLSGPTIATNHADVSSSAAEGSTIASTPPELSDRPQKRLPPSPIVVVNQSRAGSVDLGDSERKSRKSTVTDIDWIDTNVVGIQLLWAFGALVIYRLSYLCLCISVYFCITFYAGRYGESAVT